MSTRVATLESGTILGKDDEFQEPFARYFSVYNQIWKTAYRKDDIPDREYAAMSAEERTAVLGFLPAD